MYTSMLLKINIKYECKIDLNHLLSNYKHKNQALDDPLSDLFINVLFLLAINNKKHIISIIEHP